MTSRAQASTSQEKALAWFRESFKGDKDSGIRLLRDIFEGQRSEGEALDLAFAVSMNPIDKYGDLGTTRMYDELAANAGNVRKLVKKVRRTAGGGWATGSEIAKHFASEALAGRYPNTDLGDNLNVREGALLALLDAADRVAASIPARVPRRAKAEKQGNRDRQLRFLLRFLEETGHQRAPSTLALAAIACGFESPCRNGAFDARSRTWAAVLRRRRPPTQIAEDPRKRRARKLDDS